jgi:major vault protein
VFGPELIMLGPYEEISVIPLSGGYPMTEGKIRALSLELGPASIRDQIIVETVDHAKLIMDLSYNWEFRFDKKNPAEENKIF